MESELKIITTLKAANFVQFLMHYKICYSYCNILKQNSGIFSYYSRTSIILKIIPA